jgi:hypothetical protein
MSIEWLTRILTPMSLIQVSVNVPYNLSDCQLGLACKLTQLFTSLYTAEMSNVDASYCKY